MTLPSNTIDRDSPVPFYFQLSELLEQEIVSGRWEPGTRIPSENELCARYGLSRTTIRQALARLEQEGLVSREKGRGTFVSDSRPRSWLIQSTEGFFHDEFVPLTPGKGKYPASFMMGSAQGGTAAEQPAHQRTQISIAGEPAVGFGQRNVV